MSLLQMACVGGVDRIAPNLANHRPRELYADKAESEKIGFGAAA